MKVYVVNYQKDGNEYKKIILKVSNDLSGEEVFYSGFLRELDEKRNWGKKGSLTSYAELYKDKNDNKK